MQQRNINEDMQQLAEFLTSNYPPFLYDVQNVYWMIRQAKYYLLEDAGTILGCIFYVEVTRSNKKYLVITLICISSLHRGKGLAKKLIQDLTKKHSEASGACYITKHGLGKVIRTLKLYAMSFTRDGAIYLGSTYNEDWRPKYRKYIAPVIESYINIPNELLPYILSYPSVVGSWYNTETNRLSSLRYFKIASNKVLNIGYITYSTNPDEYSSLGSHSNVDVLFVYSEIELAYPFILQDTVGVRCIYKSQADLEVCKTIQIACY